MNACFLELLREEVGRFYTDMVRSTAARTSCRARSCRAPRPHPLRRAAWSRSTNPTAVTVHYQTPPGASEETADYAIVTMPFRCCATSR